VHVAETVGRTIGRLIALDALSRTVTQLRRFVRSLAAARARRRIDERAGAALAGARVAVAIGRTQLRIAASITAACGSELVVVRVETEDDASLHEEDDGQNRRREPPRCHHRIILLRAHTL
jgi:hypothetical protein